MKAAVSAAECFRSSETDAIREGVNRVHILDGRIAHCLLLEIFTDHGVGTAIIADRDKEAMFG